MLNHTIAVETFIDAMVIKYKYRDLHITDALKESWKVNCTYLNKAIENKSQSIKYIVPSPTGSGKTESMISYCSLLPTNIKAIISTNLTDEADAIANKINAEANKDIACSYHSKNDLTLSDTKDYQIVVITHSFYQKNYKGSSNWDMIANNRDLIIIDEMLDTLEHISVDEHELQRVLTIFGHIRRQHNLKLDELQNIQDLLKTLKASEKGTHLHSSTTMMKLWGEDVPCIQGLQYAVLLDILGENNVGEYGQANPFHKYGHNIKFNHILTGKDDSSEDKRIHAELIQTLKSLDRIAHRQVYITANTGAKSFNHVFDRKPEHSLVCFDATARVNEAYKLRAKYHKDIEIATLPNNIRDYSNVTLHSTRTKTGKDSIDIVIASDILSSVNLGQKTLIVTHKKNEGFFSQVINNQYNNKTIDIAHWGAITGLNKWKDYDTCIIIGLNHKPRTYAQNRTITNTDSEKRAFGTNQDRMNNSIETSVLIAEVVQAINRIRVRQINDDKGGCLPADIYITLPFYETSFYLQNIKTQMPNVTTMQWNLTSSIVYKEGKSHFDSIITYLEGNLKNGNVEEQKLRKALNINAHSFRTMRGKNDDKKVKFREKLNKAGFDIIEKIEKDKQGRPKSTPTRYFQRI